MNDQSRAWVLPAFCLPTYTRYTGTTRCYLRGEAGKYVMAPLGKPFDHPFGSWVTRSACAGVPEAGELVLSSLRPDPRWKTRFLVWKIDCCCHGSANRSCALARRKIRLVGSAFHLGSGWLQEGGIAFMEKYDGTRYSVRRKIKSRGDALTFTSPEGRIRDSLYGRIRDSHYERRDGLVPLSIT
jgi:hypothetical protein